MVVRFVEGTGNCSLTPTPVTSLFYLGTKFTIRCSSSTIDRISEVQFADAEREVARSLYQVLQLIAFYELKESSILVVLAMWKSRIDWEPDKSRADCRVSIPGPAKSLIMEYGGFARFLEPAIEGALTNVAFMIIGKR